MKVQIDITPVSRMIREWREDTRVSLEMVIKELIDNSFDAGASYAKVWHGFLSDLKDKNCVVVEDDGCGIEDIAAALRYGQSKDDHGSQRLGRYGVALKRGPARLGKVLRVRTTTTEAKTVAWVDWRQLEKQGTTQWVLDDVNIEEGFYPETGTIVEILSLYPMRIWDWKNLPEKLAATFAPGLKKGLKIIFDRVELEYKPVEGLTQQIEAEGETASGLKFQLLAGIVEEGYKASNGFSVAFGHRVIVDRWVPNFLAKYATGRFHAELLLIDSTDEEKCWTFNKWKDDFEQWQKDELAEAVKPLVAPLLESIKQDKLNIRIGVIQSFIEELLNGGDRKRTMKGSKTSEEGKLDYEHGDGTRGRKRRKKELIEKLVTPVSDKTKKQTTFHEKAFLLEFDKVSGSNEMWDFKECEPLTLTINLLHPSGAVLEEMVKNAMTPKELAGAVQTVVLILGSYLTTRHDARKKYDFLLNGTDDPHVMMRENVSEWLRKADLKFS